MTVNERNRLRAEVGLPLLDVDAETVRLTAARAQVDFEREWQRRRAEFTHQWTGNCDGWVTNMGRYSQARQQVRREVEKAPVEGQ